MPPKSVAGAKKKSVAKASILKEVAAKSSAQKVASGKHTTRGRENHLPVASSTSTSAQTSVTHVDIGAQPSEPALNEAAPKKTRLDLRVIPNEIIEKNVEIRLLQVQLARVREELRESQAAATCSCSANKEDTQVGRPLDGVKNLQEAMDLMGDSKTYRGFCRDVAVYAQTAGLSHETTWTYRDVAKLALVGNMAKKKYPFLKRFVGDWPIHEYLKKRFCNQRSYRRRIACTKVGATAQTKGKGKAVEQDQEGQGSDEKAGDEENEEAGDEENDNDNDSEF